MPDDQPSRSLTVAQEFQQDLEAYSPNLMQALPSHVSIEKFKRTIVTAVSMNPDLLQANRRTLFTAAVRAASDGVLPDGREGALVIYNTRVKRRGADGIDRDEWVKAVQFLIMTAGIRKRMRNSGDVLSADAQVVHAADHFKYSLGDNGFIEHEPAGLAEDPGPILGAYAIIKLRNGEVLRDVMRLKDIEAARAQGGHGGKPNNSLMWEKFYEEGAKKSVLRRCAKAAPQSAELEALLGDRDDEPPMLPENLQLTPPEPEPEYVEQSQSDPEPEFAVIDADGVEHVYPTAEGAERALSVVLRDAAEIGLKALEGVWDSNDLCYVSGAAAARFSELYAILAAECRLRAGNAAQAASQQRQAPAQQREPATPPPAAPDPEQAPHAPPSAPAGDLLAQAEERRTVPRRGHPTVPPGIRPADGEDSDERTGRGGVSPPDGAGPTATTHASLSDASLEIPMAPRGGKPDPRTWFIALFKPKLAQQTADTLAYFLGDNQAHIELAKRALGDDVDAAIREAWSAVG